MASDLFYSLFGDKIGTALSADNSNLYSYINISDAKAIGGHWKTGFERQGFSGSLGISYTGYYNQYHGEDYPVKDKSKTFAWSPEISASVIYTVLKIETQIGLFYKFTGELPQYQLDENDTLYLAKQGSFNTLDITLTKEIGKYFQIQAGVKNVFNVTKLTNTATGSSNPHGGGGGAVLKNYGRSWFIGISFHSPRLF